MLKINFIVTSSKITKQTRFTPEELDLENIFKQSFVEHKSNFENIAWLIFGREYRPTFRLQKVK